MKYHALALLPLIAACSLPDLGERPSSAPTVATSAPPPPASARTVEDFDTTSTADRAAAARPSSGGTRLGTTVASLGDPAQPGFWIRTPLVSAEGKGRIEFPAKGTSAEVTLIPTEGGSSRVSLAALRLLEAPLTDLSELVVYAN